jgi:hypothetical protein
MENGTIQVINLVSSAAPDAEGRGEDLALQKTLFKLRTHQVLVGLATFPVAVFFLCLAGGAMRWAWFWLIIITHGIETLSTLVLVSFPYLQSSSRRGKLSPSGSSRKHPTPIVSKKKNIIAADLGATRELTVEKGPEDNVSVA